MFTFGWAVKGLKFVSAQFLSVRDFLSQSGISEIKEYSITWELKYLICFVVD